LGSGWTTVSRKKITCPSTTGSSVGEPSESASMAMPVAVPLQPVGTSPKPKTPEHSVSAAKVTTAVAVRIPIDMLISPRILLVPGSQAALRGQPLKPRIASPLEASSGIPQYVWKSGASRADDRSH
jgi:hypothetical protein